MMMLLVKTSSSKTPRTHADLSHFLLQSSVVVATKIVDEAISSLGLDSFILTVVQYVTQ